MRIYISMDIEGVAGVVSRDHTSPAGFDYAAARQLMTNELLAAIAGASTAGATSFVVSDSHGNGNNLRYEQLPDNVELVRCWPRPLSMMQGVELDGIAGAMLIGHHAGAANACGVMSHTISSRSVTSLKLNGVEASETGLNASLAGHFGVPIILVTGDDAYIPEAVAILGEVETVVTKWSYGTFSARSLAPGAACAAIHAGAHAAIRRLGKFAPRHLAAPITVDLCMKSRLSVELLCYLPLFERTGAFSLRFTAPDMLAVSRQLAFIHEYGPNL